MLRGDKILLVQRKGSYAGQWCIPCGHVEWDEDLREAACREFQEETGLAITLAVLGLNLAGDGLNDAWHPRHSHEPGR